MLKDRFNECIDAWIRHCSGKDISMGSLDDQIINCDAYREILSMGNAALPLIRTVFDREVNSYDHPKSETGNREVFVVSIKGSNEAKDPELVEAVKEYVFGPEDQSDLAYSKILRIAKIKLKNTILTEYKNGQRKVVVISINAKDWAEDPEFVNAVENYIYSKEDHGLEFHCRIMKMAQEKTSTNLPMELIKEAGLARLVKGIVGDDFIIPKNIQSGNLVEAYTKKWLDENMHKYVS